MRCANASCQCQIEASVERDGKDFCCPGCASSQPGVAKTCRCGHQGCAGSEESTFAEGGGTQAEDAPPAR